MSYRTILRFENDQRDIKADKVAAIRRAFEAAGVRFIDTGEFVGALAAPLRSG